MQLSKVGSSQIVAATNPKDYLSATQAAAFIGKSRKTIYNYVKLGLLRPTKNRGYKKLMFNKSDLGALLEVQNHGVDPRDAKDLLKVLMWRLGMIESRLNFLMRVNGLDVSILRDAPIETLLGAYEQVVQILEDQNTNPVREVMEQWAHVFLQFTECEYGRLADAAVDPKPWKPFNLLCHLYMRNLRKKKGFEGNIQHQQAYRLLEKARKNIARSALSFEELYSVKQGAPRVASLAVISAPFDTLDRFIAAEAKKGQ